MAAEQPTVDTKSESDGRGKQYTVVARRYRPRSFAELVGQDTVAQALATAIRSNRVGHAYLFTGARGVGKTSTARIFAKALNAPRESHSAADGSPHDVVIDVDQDSDIAQAIDAGEDMDVLEIDGASNRGIDEIRQLRANVNVRPSRSKYKIYIIDEVHMLTGAAFNALLKTLEEPPEHVKFIFCTTDPEKIPITVLSRCQRFDFPPVKIDSIQNRLAFICEKEGFESEPEALRLIARRAAGSMRDSQSLLEQVMSFCEGKISVDQVNEMLGTSDEGSLRNLVEQLIAHEPVAALEAVEQAALDGVDAGQLAEQLLGYFRDLMAIGVGGSAHLLRNLSTVSVDELRDQANRWGLQSVLAALQLLDETLVRMRHSMHSRALLEVALVQISQLQRLELLMQIAAGIATASPGAAGISGASGTATAPRQNMGASLAAANNAAAEKKKVEPSLSSAATSGLSSQAAVAKPHAAASQSVPKPNLAVSNQATTMPAAAPSKPAESVVPQAPQVPQSPPRPASVGQADLATLWKQVAERLDGLVGDFAKLARAVERQGDGSWLIVLPGGSEKAIEYMQRSDRRGMMEQTASSVAGMPVRIQFVVRGDAPNTPSAATSQAPVNNAASRTQKMRQVAEHPMIAKVLEQLGGEVVRVDPPSRPMGMLTTRPESVAEPP